MQARSCRFRPQGLVAEAIADCARLQSYPDAAAAPTAAAARRALVSRGRPFHRCPAFRMRGLQAAFYALSKPLDWPTLLLTGRMTDHRENEGGDVEGNSISH
jgi:hypothetical protein